MLRTAYDLYGNRAVIEHTRMFTFLTKGVWDLGMTAAHASSVLRKHFFN